MNHYWLKRLTWGVLIALFVCSCSNLQESAPMDEGTEWQPGQEIVTEDGRVYKTGYWQGNPVTVEVLDGDYVFQGDMIISPEQFSNSLERGAFGYDSMLWPGGIIPYEISEEFTYDQVKAIQWAIDHWNYNVVSLTFVERTDEKQYINFLINRDPDKQGYHVANLGRNLGGATNIQLWTGQKLVPGSIVHEIGHAIGMYHEHSRSDRDQYIRVHMENYSGPNSESNMAMHIGPVFGEFDFDSVMMYGPYSGNGSLPDNDVRYATITKIGPNGEDVEYETQRIGLSPGDILEVESMYGNWLYCPFRTPTFTDYSSGPNYTLTIDGFYGDADDIKFLAADYDRDGYQDIIAVVTDGFSGNKIRMYVFNGKPESGQFKRMMMFDIPISRREDIAFDYDYVVTDWNEDGTLDLIIIGKTTRSAYMRYKVMDGNPSDTLPYYRSITRGYLDYATFNLPNQWVEFFPCMIDPADPEYKGLPQIKGIVMTWKEQFVEFDSTNTVLRYKSFTLLENKFESLTNLNKFGENLPKGDNYLFRTGYFDRDFSPDMYIIEKREDPRRRGMYLHVYNGNIYRPYSRSFMSSNSRHDYRLYWTKGQPDDFLVMDIDNDDMYQIVLIKYRGNGTFDVTVRK